MKSLILFCRGPNFFILRGGWGGGGVREKACILRTDNADALLYILYLPVASSRGWEGICHVSRSASCPLQWRMQGRGPLFLDQTEAQKAEKNFLELEPPPPSLI